MMCSFCASSKRSDLWDNMLPKDICRLPKGLGFGAGLVPKLNNLDGAILVVEDVLPDAHIFMR